MLCVDCYAEHLLCLRYRQILRRLTRAGRVDRDRFLVDVPGVDGAIRVACEFTWLALIAERLEIIERALLIDEDAIVVCIPDKYDALVCYVHALRLAARPIQRSRLLLVFATLRKQADLVDVGRSNEQRAFCGVGGYQRRRG